MVVEGSGRVKLDDEIVELKKFDAIRVSPETIRCFEGGRMVLATSRSAGRARSPSRRVLPGLLDGLAALVLKVAVFTTSYPRDEARASRGASSPISSSACGNAGWR